MSTLTMDTPFTCIGYVVVPKFLTVALLCFINLINYADRYVLPGVLRDVQKEFDLSDDITGLMQTAFVVAYMISAPLFGYFGDRYSRRLIIAAGLLLWSSAQFVGSFMYEFNWFLASRCVLGVGEASYLVIAPAVICDLFVGQWRSTMLSAFYFCMPFGAAIGYIIGSQFAHWRYALRVTPIFSVFCLFCIKFTPEPKRGESEVSQNLKATSYAEDLIYFGKNPSFILITLGSTFLAFSGGALAWWVLTVLVLGCKVGHTGEDMTPASLAFVFGSLALLSGILGVPMGTILSQRLTPRYPTADAFIAGGGLLISASIFAIALWWGMESMELVFALIFFAQLSLNLNWAVVADMLMYVIVPFRRASGQALVMLIQHMFGDAGSPYIIGVLSENFKDQFRKEANAKDISMSNELKVLSLKLIQSLNSTTTTTSSIASAAMLQTTTTELSTKTKVPIMAKMVQDDDTDEIKFKGLQYALLITCVIQALGGIFLLLLSLTIVRDRRRADFTTRKASLITIHDSIATLP